MKQIYLLIFLILFTAQTWAINQSEFIIWNVGQGQWTTYITPNHCLHFDMGGEKAPLPMIHKLCHNKQNIIFLSHWDYDHISFATTWLKINPSSCLWLKPIGKTTTKRELTFAKVKMCTANTLAEANPLFKNIYKPPANTKTTNDRSYIHIITQEKILIPGDSSTKQEKIWKTKISTSQIKGLVLGHHGSRTSTSNELLNKLPNLKWAIASAREKKYGHPHQETIKRIKDHKIALIKTEDWGNIHILSDSN